MSGVLGCDRPWDWRTYGLLGESWRRSLCGNGKSGEVDGECSSVCGGVGLSGVGGKCEVREDCECERRGGSSEEQGRGCDAVVWGPWEEGVERECGCEVPGTESSGSKGSWIAGVESGKSRTWL